tara:strand:- start:64 stop:798 length:735 start_codon:yes stop_codon:yes gene_type:complete
MANKLKSSVIFFLLISKSIFSQWQYEVEGKSLEKIFVDDTNNISTFLIQKAANGDITFTIEKLDLDICPVGSIDFRFDNYSRKLNFEVEKVGANTLKILFNRVDGLEELKDFTKLIKAKNYLYTTLIDQCEINAAYNYTLKGSSIAINRIRLIPFLERTIKILEAKKNKMNFIISSIPRLEKDEFSEKSLKNINPLEITDVYWKNAGQNKYSIKIRVKLNGKGFRELYGDFRLFKPVDKIKFRY